MLSTHTIFPFCNKRVMTSCAADSASVTAPRTADSTRSAASARAADSAARAPSATKSAGAILPSAPFTERTEVCSVMVAAPFVASVAISDRVQHSAPGCDATHTSTEFSRTASAPTESSLSFSERSVSSDVCVTAESSTALASSSARRFSAALPLSSSRFSPSITSASPKPLLSMSSRSISTRSVRWLFRRARFSSAETTSRLADFNGSGTSGTSLADSSAPSPSRDHPSMTRASRESAKEIFSPPLDALEGGGGMVPPYMSATVSSSAGVMSTPAPAAAASSSRDKRASSSVNGRPRSIVPASPASRFRRKAFASSLFEELLPPNPAGYILLYHGSAWLYHSRVPGRPSCISRMRFDIATSTTSSSLASSTASVSTSRRTDAPAVIVLSVFVKGELSATPNEAITPSPSCRSFTEATESGAPFTRQLAPTRTAAAAASGMASDSRVKSSSLTTSTMRVGHEMGGRPDA